MQTGDRSRGGATSKKRRKSLNLSKSPSRQNLQSTYGSTYTLPFTRRELWVFDARSQTKLATRDEVKRLGKEGVDKLPNIHRKK